MKYAILKDEYGAKLTGCITQGKVPFLNTFVFYSERIKLYD